MKPVSRIGLTSLSRPPPALGLAWPYCNLCRKHEPAAIEALAGTAELDWPEADLSPRMMLAAHSFVEAQIEKANHERKAIPQNDAAQADSRQQLKKILGVVDERVTPRMETFGDAENPAIVFETEDYQVFQVRWPVLASVQGEGLWVRQREAPVGHVVLVPDANQHPEDLFGFSQTDEAPLREVTIGRRLAENGFSIIIPAIVSRNSLATTDARRQQAEYSQREWIYRQAFHMGRHVIGYDLQRVLAAVDWLQSHEEAKKIGIAGYGEGGLIALHAAAIDPRITTAWVSGYFNSSNAVWNEPIYRNVWSRLLQFGNAQVASLIAPRRLIIEHSEFPAVKDHKGELQTPSLAGLREEFESIPQHEQMLRSCTGQTTRLSVPTRQPGWQNFASPSGNQHVNSSSWCQPWIAACPHSSGQTKEPYGALGNWKLMSRP